METMMEAGYELATILVPAFAAYAIVQARSLRSGKASARFAPVLLFALYVFAVLYVTGAGTVHDAVRHGSGVGSSQVSLVPFAFLLQSNGDALAGFVLNIVLFVPLGFLLPCTWPRMRHALPVAAFGLGLSLAVELSQLANNRTTDVDDLLANALGALIGFALWVLWSFVADRFAAARRQAGSHAARSSYPSASTRLRHALAEPAFYVAAMFAGRFLLFDELCFAELLFGLS